MRRSFVGCVLLIGILQTTFIAVGYAEPVDADFEGEEIPNEWYGEHGLVLHTERAEKIDGTLSRGDAILSIPFSHRRSGTVENSIEAKNGLVVPEGSFAYAMKLGATKVSTSRPTSNTELDGNLVSWCIVLDDQQGRKGKSGQVCILPSPMGEHKYYISKRLKNPYYPYFVSIFGGDLSFGPLPRISVSNIDPDRDLQAKLLIRKMTKKYVMLITEYCDGDEYDYRLTRGEEYHWNSEGRVSIHHKLGTIELTRESRKKIKVEWSQ